MLRGTDHPESIFSEEQLNNIIDDLRNTSISFRKLGEKYNTTSTTINEIDKGKVYHNDMIDYPIRKDVNIIGKLNDEDVDKIIDLLQHTYKSFEEIAKMFSVEAISISKINNGTFHKRDIDYPIRKFKNTSSSPNMTYEQVTEAIDLIMNTEMSLRKIAKKFNVELNTIIGIKNGTTKMYRRNEYEYPLRKNN